MNNKIIIIAGFSGSGKDTAAKWAADEGYNFVVSTTTRALRVGECQGNPYHFISYEEFEQREADDKFLEVREYNTLVDGKKAVWKYGVEKSEIKENKPYAVVLDIVGVRAFKELFGDRCSVVFIDVDYATRRARCIERGDYNETEFTRRWEDDIKCFPEDVVDTLTDEYIHNNRSEAEFFLDFMYVLEEIEKGE